MNRFNFKMCLVAISFAFATNALAYQTSGIGKLDKYIREGEKMEEVSGSYEWCITKVLSDKINCSNRENISSTLGGLVDVASDTHSLLCSVHVAVAPVLTSDFDDIALGKEVFDNDIHVWAFHAKFPAGSALQTYLTMPMYLVKSQVDGVINLATYGSLDLIKGELDSKTYSSQLISDIQGQIMAKTCENYKGNLSNEYRVKKTLKSNKVLRVEDYGPAIKRSEDSYRSCGYKETENVVNVITYQVNPANGHITNKILSQEEIRENNERNSFCEYGKTEEESKNNCNEVSKNLKFQMDYESGNAKQKTAVKPPKK